MTLELLQASVACWATTQVNVVELRELQILHECFFISFSHFDKNKITHTNFDSTIGVYQLRGTPLEHTNFGVLQSWHIVDNQVTFVKHSANFAAHYIVTAKLKYFKRRNHDKKKQEVNTHDSILKKR